MIHIIDHKHKEYCLTCDLCGEEVADSFYHFDDAVDYKKANGWVGEMRCDGGWEDICPDCQANT